MDYQIYELIDGAWNLIRRIPNGDDASIMAAMENESVGPDASLFTVFRATGRHIVGYTPSGDRLMQSSWQRRGFTGRNGRVIPRSIPWGKEGFMTTDWADIGPHGPVMVVPRPSHDFRS